VGGKSGEAGGETKYRGGILAGKLLVSWKHATGRCVIQGAKGVNYHSSLPRLEAIADPRLSHDISRGAFVHLELPSQMAYEDPKIFRLLHAVLSPNGGKEHTMGNNFSRMAREVYQ
jgi:hypothetical protein